MLSLNIGVIEWSGMKEAASTFLICDRRYNNIRQIEILLRVNNTPYGSLLAEGWPFFNFSRNSDRTYVLHGSSMHL